MSTKALRRLLAIFEGIVGLQLYGNSAYLLGNLIADFIWGPTWEHRPAYSDAWVVSWLALLVVCLLGILIVRRVLRHRGETPLAFGGATSKALISSKWLWAAALLYLLLGHFTIWSVIAAERFRTPTSENIAEVAAVGTVVTLLFLLLLKRTVRLNAEAATKAMETSEP